ncbi:MAG TPA: hypothetical protein VFX85_09595 [Solirubrobacterales bacterium]|nr:hypothetical protein [Solirubrobacterales bacterium]
MKRLLPIAALLALVIASLAQAEVTQRGNVRVKSDGQITPDKLPREGSAPVRVSVSSLIDSTKKGISPPQLREIEIAINRHGTLDSTGLPVCEMLDIQPATTQKALAACRGSLVGEGKFSAEVALSRQSPFPSDGKMLAFSGVYEGKPAILAHVYGEEPVPTSFTLPFVITGSKGAFGTVLTAKLPAGDNNIVTGIELNLQRNYTYRGKRRAFASAGCPAPKGFSRAPFPFAKVSYAFVGGRKLSQTLTRSCKVR